MRAKQLSELPQKYACRICGLEKPIAEMILIRMRRTGELYLRPRCKQCHNNRERGSRREYKRNYLRRWRVNNPDVNESHWRNWQALNRDRLTQLAAVRRRKNLHALAIQRRLRKQAAMHVTLLEAKGLLRKYGRCYPTRFGLTDRGLKECERIRAAMRRTGVQELSPVEIRMMVYEDAYEDSRIAARGTWEAKCTGTEARFYMVPPAEQCIPYRCSAENLRRWWKRKKAEGGAAA